MLAPPRGSNSVVECNLAKVDVAGSNPVSRSSWKRDALWCAALYAAFLAIYGIASWDRLKTHSPDNHFVYMADSFLHGQFHLTRPPPHGNDWARYDGKVYVSFPPLPAVLMMPFVWKWGYSFNDRLFTWFFTPFPVVILFLALTYLSRTGRSGRKEWENVALASLFGVGTVYFFSAIQGSVWFVGHVFGTALMAGYLLFSLDARRPLLAGVCLGLGFLARTPVGFAFPFFLLEACRMACAESGAVGTLRERALPTVRTLLRSKWVVRILLFAIVPAICLAAAMIINEIRFGDPMEFGHRYLDVRWSSKFSKWGLLNYHFVSRNLTAMFTLLPWISRVPPYLQISNHGLALWFTSPFLMWIVWPARKDTLTAFLWVAAILTAIPSVMYQNTGWVQFGYRFANDYMPALFLLMALSGRRMGGTFWAAAVFAVVVNTFGAVTFGGVGQFYAPGSVTMDYFQPD